MGVKPAATDPPFPATLLDDVDVFRGRPCSVATLSGGLTNRNFKVTTPDGAYVVRLCSPDAGLLAVDREHEFRNSVIAAASGVGAPVVEYRPDDCAMILTFLDGATFTDGHFAEPGVIERVASACRQLHDGPRFVNDFDMFEIQRGYLALVMERGYRLPDGYLDHAGQVERIRGALAVRREPNVACNNDLLAGNLIDGGDRVHLIDYEYSGNNDACFELGNLWSECHLDDDQLEHLITCYYGRRAPAKEARARLQGLMSRYGWTLWAAIQDATSDLDFDFWSWGLEKYEAAVEVFRSPALDRLIELVQQAE